MQHAPDSAVDDPDPLRSSAQLAMVARGICRGISRGLHTLRPGPVDVLGVWTGLLDRPWVPGRGHDCGRTAATVLKTGRQARWVRVRVRVRVPGAGCRVQERTTSWACAASFPIDR